MGTCQFDVSLVGGSPYLVEFDGYGADEAFEGVFVGQGAPVDLGHRQRAGDLTLCPARVEIIDKRAKMRCCRNKPIGGNGHANHGYANGLLDESISRLRTVETLYEQYRPTPAPSLGSLRLRAVGPVRGERDRRGPRIVAVG